jgi:hypothetical protein
MGLTRPRAAQIYNLDYKQATRVVTVADITLTGGAPSQVDGVNLSANDRVLVTGQATTSQNGLYLVAAVGSGSNGTWTRTNDGNETGEIEAGMIVMVTEGLIYADTQWKLITDNPIDIGTTPLIFSINILSTVGGANTQVQYNRAGTLGGSTNFTFDGSNVTVTGNIAGSYILGNGSQLTGIPSTYSDSNVVTLLANFGSNSISTTGDITAGNVNSPHADLAEMYVADAEYPPGIVVEFGGDYEITIARISHSTTVAGITSTNPSYLMNSAQAGEHVIPVALTGRVPCQVIGTIAKGDRLVASDYMGAAERLDLTKYQPGCIVGKALENYDSESIGIIEVAVGRF